tara:strand:- start:1539 stop:3062 length:1524 start_codon:yes stop_codon:yes gene_type:complete
MKSLFKKYILLSIFISSSAMPDCLTMYEEYYKIVGFGSGNFDLLEYVFGEGNCCDEYYLPMCGDDRVYFEKEDYADFTDSDNWDIISNNIALTRADNRGLYNPLFESEYGVLWGYEGSEYGSPNGSLWSFGPAFTDAFVTYGTWFTWAYVAFPGLVSMYSTEDDAYYDFYITSWTSGNGTGFPSGGDGNGNGNGGGFSYYRSGAVKPLPAITSIEDVPNDQGGRVYITFDRSPLDVNVHPHGIDIYTIQRFVSPNWVGLGSIPGLGQSSYTYEATTTVDSLGQSNDSTIFRVIALNYAMDYTFYSDEYNGYSVDNIAPGVPEGLNVTLENTQAIISWLPSFDDDFQYYSLEKDTNATFQNAQTFNLAQNTFIDFDIEDGITYLYRIRSADYSGNLSAYSEVVQLSTLYSNNANIVDDFILHQNYPNPFNPITSLRYGLPETGLVNITIYDMHGRIIKTLVNGIQTAGFKSVQWNATNDRNEPVSAGLYLYTIQAGEFRQTRKMVLLK